MTPTAISTMFGIAGTPGSTKPAQSPIAQPFGDFLSQGLGNRDSGAAPVPARSAAQTRENAGVPPQPSQQPSPRQQSGNAGDTAPLARQNAQRSQGQHPQQGNDSATASQAGSVQSAANGDTDSPNHVASSKSPAGASKPKAAEDTTTSDAAAESDGAASSAAAATLLALVNGMAPRATPGATPTADTAVPGQCVTGAAGKTAALSADADPGAADQTGASDPAFDALLAQAARLTEGRNGGRTTAGGNGVAPVDPGAAVAGVEPATFGRAQTAPGSAAATAAFVDQIQGDAGAAVPGLELAKLAEPALLPALPGAATTIAVAANTGGGQGPGNTLAPHVGTAAWDHALGQKVVWMAAGAEQTASLTLNPPDLGPLQVVINVSNAHAEASFTAAQPEVRQALEAAMPKLKEMLADAGILLGQTSVGSGSPNQHGAAHHQANARAGQSHSGALTDTVGPATRVRPQPRRGGNGLVDTFA